MGLFDRFKKDKRQQLPPQQADGLVLSAKKEEKKKEEKAKEEKAPEAKTEKKIPSATDKNNSAYKVLLRPFISEKAAGGESRGVYTFVVQKSANKFQISEAIASVYKVMPARIRVVNMAGKITRRGRQLGRRRDWKKAIVTLPPGQSISIHEGV